MEVFVLDKSLNTLSVFDTFESFIWVERFNSYGDFELYSPADAKEAKNMQRGNYIYRKDTKKLMVIDTFQITTDVENGNHMTVSGKSLESILSNYVVYPEITLNGNFQSEIFRLIRNNIKISNITYKYSYDSAITSLSIDAYYYGDNLYDAVQSQCAEKNIGFRILPDWNGGYVFELYAGKNRSYSQSSLPWIIFSPKFGNFISSNYIESDTNLANVCYVVGEAHIPYYDEEGIEQMQEEAIHNTVYSDYSATGLNRREIFYDAGTISADSISEAYTILQSKAKEELRPKRLIKDFEGTIESTHQYTYGKDYDIGDIVQVENAYGQRAESRVSEVIYSLDTTGERIIPTFTFLKKEDE